MYISLYILIEQFVRKTPRVKKGLTLSIWYKYLPFFFLHSYGKVRVLNVHTLGLFYAYSNENVEQF